MKTPVLKSLLFVAIAAIAFCCQKTAPPSGSTTNNGNNTTTCTNANLSCGNIWDTLNGYSSRFDVRFYHFTTQNHYNGVSDNSGIVSVNGFKVSALGNPVTFDTIKQSSTPVWTIQGNSLTGISPNTYTAPAFSMMVSLVAPDTIHRSKAYTLNYTSNNSDSIFVTFKSYGDSLVQRFSKGSLPAQMVFSPNRMSHVDITYTNTTTISIIAANYSYFVYNGITYTIKTYWNRLYYVSIVN